MFFHHCDDPPILQIYCEAKYCILFLLLFLYLLACDILYIKSLRQKQFPYRDLNSQYDAHQGFWFYRNAGTFSQVI